MQIDTVSKSQKMTPCSREELRMASTGQLYIVFLNMLAWNLFSIQFGTRNLADTI